MKKVSVITVCRNAAATIEATLASVAAQSHPLIEHCIIDGASSDGTVEILKAFKGNIRWVSGPDCGIYDAMNKGVTMAGGDIIGFLNADDVYAHGRVVSDIVQAMQEYSVDACFADIEFRDDTGKVLRRYDSSRFSPGKLVWGWMPAHPSLYVKRKVFEEYGGFRTHYRIAGDFEFVVRVFSSGHCSYHYVPDVWVHMRPGGVSSRGLKSWWVLNREIVTACRENGLKTSLPQVLMKIPYKLAELVWR